MAPDETMDKHSGGGDEDGPAPGPTREIRGASTVVGDLAAIATGRITAAVLSLLTVLMTTRLLGPAGYGTIAIVNIIGMLVFTASAAWTGVSVRRYGREELEGRRDLSRLTWNRTLIAAPLLAIAATAVVSLKLAGALPASLTWDLVSLSLLMGVTYIVVDHWVCLLETSGRMKTSALGQVSSQAIYVICLAVVFAFGLAASPSLIVALAILSSLVFAIAAVPVLWRTGIVPISFDRRLLRRMLWLSVPLIGLVMSQYVFASVDIVTLGIFRSQADVGVYAVAYQAYTVLSAAAITATAVFLPLFVSLQMAERQHLVARYLEKHVPQLLFVIAVAAGIGIAVGPLAVPVVFGEEFADASKPLAVLGLGLAFLFSAYLIAPILTLHEQTRATAAINGVAALINVVADVVMLGVLGMGIIAPAIATAAALAFVFVAFYFRARGTLGTSGRPGILLGAPVIASLAAVLALEGAIGTIVALAAVMAIAAAILVWRCPFSREDIDLVRKLEMPAAVKRFAVRAIEFVT